MTDTVMSITPLNRASFQISFHLVSNKGYTVLPKAALEQICTNRAYLHFRRSDESLEGGIDLLG